MAQVPYVPYPTAQPESRGTPNISLNTPGAAFGENIGQAVEGLGHTLTHSGDELFNRALALQQLQNETVAKEADADYMLKVGEKHAQFSALQGKDAVAAYPAYAQDLKDLRTKTRDALPTDQSRKMFDGSSLSTLSRTVFNGAGHAATQQKQWSIGTAKAQIDLDAKSVEDDPRDDILMKNKENRINKSVDELVDLQGLGADSPQAKDLKMNAISKLWAQRITGLARTAPFEAAKLLDENKTNLTGPDYLKVDNVVRSQGRAVGSANIANSVYSGGRGDDETAPKPLKQLEEEARAKAKEQSPDDPILAEHAVQGVRGLYNQDKYAMKQQDWENSQIISGAIEQGVRTEQELRADPKVAAAIDALPKDKRLSIPGQINRYNAARDKVSQQDAYQKLYGLSNNDVEAFLNTDVTKEPLSQQDMRALQEKQRKLKQNQNSDPRVSRAIGQIRGAMGSQLEALGIYNRGANNKDDYDKYTGAVQSALDVWQENNGKPPTYKDVTETIAPQIIRQMSEPGWLYGTNKVPFFKQSVPEPFAEKLKADVVAKGGVEPSAEQIQKAYVRTQFIKLYGKKDSSSAQ